MGWASERKYAVFDHRKMSFQHRFIPIDSVSSQEAIDRNRLKRLRCFEGMYEVAGKYDVLETRLSSLLRPPSPFLNAYLKHK